MLVGWSGRRRRGAGRLLFAALALALIAGCSASSKGTYHVVQRGDTLYRIGKAYGVSYEELAAANDIADPSRIEVGQRLLIPGAKRQVPVDVVAPREPGSRRPLPDPKLPPDKRPFIWPVPGGQLSSLFGPRGRSHHDGIDILADEGTPVYAAADGVVAYADELRGYGRVIIIRHTDDYATVYAHNQKNLVHEGQSVKRGQVIAQLGDSGRTTAPNLHFEVRRENIACDPLNYLPPEPRVAGR
jgi:lipoprotein NlpD